MPSLFQQNSPPIRLLSSACTNKIPVQTVVELLLYCAAVRHYVALVCQHQNPLLHCSKRLCLRPGLFISALYTSTHSSAHGTL